MYNYLLTQRPIGIGTHPISNLIGTTNNIQFRGRYCTLLTYSEPLTVKEVLSFELTPDYTSNPPQPHKTIYAGLEEIHFPKVNGNNSIVSKLNYNDEIIEMDYTFLGWFRFINNLDF